LFHALSVRLYLLTHRDDGQTMAEYAIVLAVISIAIIGAIGLLGTNIKTALSTVASKV
jgi:Flp pilus assembly pilin Flp